VAGGTREYCTLVRIVDIQLKIGNWDILNTRAVRKVTSDELLTKQRMRKRKYILYKKYVHT
jgi:hypothetical protein